MVGGIITESLILTFQLGGRLATLPNPIIGGANDATQKLTFLMGRKLVTLIL
jgi:hypothetical protein